MTRYAAFIAVLFAAATGSAHAVQWFPPAPGAQEQRYLVYNDPCRSMAPIGRPTLTRLAAFGTWRFELTRKDDQLCDPVIGSQEGATYAFAIPEDVGGHSVAIVEVVEHLVGHANQTSTVTKTLVRPLRSDMPESVSGTWTLDGAASQGLLLVMDESRNLAVSFNSFDAAGKPAWYTGMAETSEAGAVVALMDVPFGKFAGTPTTPVSPREWGSLHLTYKGCGELQGAWLPLPGTGLPTNIGTFRQLTPALGAGCDLHQYASRCGGAVVFSDFDIVD